MLDPARVDFGPTFSEQSSISLPMQNAIRQELNEGETLKCTRVIRVAPARRPGCRSLIRRKLTPMLCLIELGRLL